jgi:hypothetical protein
VQYKQGASPVSLTTLEPVADASLAPEDADKVGRRRRRRRGRRRGPGGEGGESGGGPDVGDDNEHGPAGDEPSRGEPRSSSVGDGGADPAQS